MFHKQLLVPYHTKTIKINKNWSWQILLLIISSKNILKNLPAQICFFFHTIFCKCKKPFLENFCSLWCFCFQHTNPWKFYLFFLERFLYPTFSAIFSLSSTSSLNAFIRRISFFLTSRNTCNCTTNTHWLN